MLVRCSKANVTFAKLHEQAEKAVMKNFFFETRFCICSAKLFHYDLSPHEKSGSNVDNNLSTFVFARRPRLSLDSFKNNCREHLRSNFSVIIVKTLIEE